MPYVLGVVTAVLCVLRVCGVTSIAFQAVAHLWVGGLFGAALIGFLAPAGHKALNRWVFLILAIVLTVVETLCFLYLPK